MIKEFCDICKVEIDNQNVLAIVSTPVKNYKVCKMGRNLLGRRLGE